MPDSGAVRAQRHRLHKRGNHSMCKRGCGELRQAPRLPVEIPQVSAASGDFDAVARMQDLAEQLRQASAADPSDAVLAREYRLTLMELAKGGDGDKTDPFAELLKELSGPVPSPVGDSAH